MSDITFFMVLILAGLMMKVSEEVVSNQRTILDEVVHCRVEEQ